MGRPSTLPTLYDEVNTVSITKLKEWGFLIPNIKVDSIITWSRNGTKTSSIGIEINTTEMWVRLYYIYRKTDEVDYKIRLVKIPSNLGKGYLWYFVCPYTGKMCRKLYSIGREFLHRGIYKNYRYESQTYSERNKAMYKIMDAILKGEKASEEIHSKNFKKYYNGKPTKKYIKLNQQLNRADNFPPDTMNRLMVGIY